MSVAHPLVLINLGVGGALVEHMNPVRRETVSFLTLVLHGQELTLKCRVARSVIHRSEVQTDGKRALVYRTGLQFLNIPESSRQLIHQYIESLKGEN